MATLIWSKVRNIRIGDTHVPFEVKYDDGSSLVADSSSMGYALAQAVNGQGGIELCLRSIGWSLNRGQPDYDWASFWEIADAESNIIYEGSGDIGYLRDYSNKGLEKVGYGYDLSASNWVASGESFSISGNSHAPLQPYWNIENESVYVDIPVINNNWWWEDDDGVWKLKIRHDSNDSGYQTLHSALGDLGGYDVNGATWYDHDLDGYLEVPLEDITNEILYGLKLTLTQNQSSVIDWIHGTAYNTSSYSSFVPMSITQEAPDFDFSVSLSGLSNLPSMVIDGETVEGIVTITSSGFSGSIQVYAFDHEDDIDSFNSILGTALDENDQAQYGTVSAQYQFGDTILSHTIGIGESIDVPITYTANEGISQIDSYSIIVSISSLDSSDYEDFSFEAQQQFDNLSDSDKIIYSDVPTIMIINSQQIPVETYTPSEQLIEKPSDIIFHLLEQELGYDKEVDFDSLYYTREEELDWRLSFCLNEKIDGKKLMKEISQSSKIIPTLSADKLKFIPIKNTYDGTENISTISANDVLKYKFSRTPLRDVRTEIEVKYGYDIGMKKYLKSTGKVSLGKSYFKTGTYNNLDPLAQPNISFSSYGDNYYGLKIIDSSTILKRIDHNDTSEIIETKYISDENTALALANHKLHLNRNVHNIIEMSIPLKYYNLEIGDLIEFDKMILGDKVYGEKYVIDDPHDMPIRAGQYILPLFMITSTTKGLKDIKIKAIQLHHLNNSDLTYKGETYQTVYNYIESLPTYEGEGDINEDGDVNILDAVIMVNHIAGINELSVEQLEIADINEDSLVNIMDLVILINIIVTQDND